MQVIYVKKVVVSIQRDIMQKVTKAVYAHEVEILQEIHGDQSIEILEPDQYDIDAHILERPIYDEDAAPGEPPIMRSTTWPIDLGDEYARLQSMYGLNDQGEPLVDHIYGPLRRSRMVTEYAVKADKGTKIGKAKELGKSARAVLAQSERTSQPAAQSQEIEVSAEILAMKVPELRAALDELGIEYDDGMSDAELRQLLADALDEDDDGEEAA